jgi:hypothetical protein
MTVIVDHHQCRLGTRVLRRLVDAGCLPRNAQTHTLEDAEYLQHCEKRDPGFVVSPDLERLRAAVKALRTFTKRPLVAISNVGSLLQMIPILRDGATDYLDAGPSFEVNARRILNRLARNEDADVVSAPLEVCLDGGLNRRTRPSHCYFDGL